MRRRAAWLGLLAACLFAALPAWAEARLLLPASMARLTRALEKAYLEDHAGAELTIITGASSLLARQVAQGLEAHVIVTANRQWMDFLADNALIDPASRRPYVENSLVVATASQNVQAGFDFMALASHVGSGSRLALCGPGPVPCGVYAKDALVKAGMWDRVEPFIVYGQDAAAIRHWVERGSVAYGILYKSDLADNVRLRAISAVPSAFTGAVVYDIAAIAGQSPTQRQALLTFMTGAKTGTIMEAGGFLMKIPGLP